MWSGVLSIYVRISLPGALGPLELYKNCRIMWICTLFYDERSYLSDFQRALCPPKDEKLPICQISSDLSYTYEST